jgi:alpha,alpha-trehalase
VIPSRPSVSRNGEDRRDSSEYFVAFSAGEFPVIAKAPSRASFPRKLLLLNDLQRFILTQNMHPRRITPHFSGLRWPAAKRLRPLLLTLPLALTSASVSAQQSPKTPAVGLEPIRSYISSGWNTLSRSLSDCATFSDSKLTGAPQLYLPSDFPEPEAVKQLETRCKVQVRNLPPSGDRLGKPGAAAIYPPGLLYLENRYVVPGGRFNEMYGWDSYFIIVGLLRDGRLDLAQDMVNNFLFEVEHYGAVLNANRTYYLTRSQPPFLTSMILGVYGAQKAAGHEDRAWLTKAFQLAIKDHSLWDAEPHLAGSTGLSRYFDFGDGPAPESVQDETGHYREVVAYFLAHPEQDRNLLVRKAPGQTSPLTVGSTYSLQVCDLVRTMAKPECTVAADVALSSDFYKGDRSMRESGYDISFRFGPYGAGTHHFAPVCLNSLLYKSERDLEQISTILGRKVDVEQWKKRAEERKANIQKYLWNSQRGLFVDYDFVQQAQSSYDYVTTFFPLWAGLATPEQAQALVQHLATFEQPGGLVMSPHETGGQWDFPYAWAPDQLIADEGLRKYGFNKEADRVSYKFLSTVAENFRRDGTIREKYNAVTRSSETQVTAGYHMNIVGFGWTNGAFLELLHDLPVDLVQKLAGEQGSSATAAH